jgi:uncharacterized protein YbjQ (UPF0145 family)
VIFQLSTERKGKVMPGLVVVDIDPLGQAAKLGIRLHDVLFKYNGSVLNTIEDLINPAIVEATNELSVIRCRQVLELKALSGSLGISLVPFPIPDTNIEGVGEVISGFSTEVEIKTEAQKQAQQSAMLVRIANIQITTTPQIEGFRVAKTLDIITAEYVGGINIFCDIFASVSDLVGGRSGTMQNELRTARETCLANLKIEADRIGANAVIGVDLDYSEISGGGKSMLFLVASGTAVIVEKLGD